MAKIKPKESTRELWQGLAVIGGIIISIHAGYIIYTFKPAGLFGIMTAIELIYGVLTAIIDTWFLIKT